MSVERGSPLVSIVLPTYRRPHLLPHAIRSVLAQSYPHWELIVVDDNSPDHTPEVVASFTDPRIRAVRNDPNLKLPRTLNRGFALASGELLTWTSDDNLYHPQAIEKMVARLQRGDCDFVYADYWLFSELDAAGAPLDIQHDRLPDRLQLERGNHIGACFMYSRALAEAVGEYDPELFLVEDYDYFIRAARQFRFAHIAEPLYYFKRDDATLYISRYCEVKASDLLVRYRNGLLDGAGVVEAVVELLLRNIAGLKNPLLRGGHALLRTRSFRLTNWHAKLTSHHLRRQLHGPVLALLDGYRQQQRSFGESRQALVALINALGAVSYQ
ncbi:MAG TPA: glycosyltransferase [Pseudomonadales bacterium]|jgi:glycosyltransferase involved in cell wall biosynthesis|nr:glycosyltransferase [Pseudomonadales bacterium]HMW14869.1 glycosyltransferase [Pseudomonadales bacterium]HMW84068.1 glycosyltransferase [Pseudomonadales bacterium]HMY96828.1 glycosyltransferase [Pseudomonadales bacterium]HMZ71719.1 glycosyltransferase [Pseudomonadales bacterium]